MKAVYWSAGLALIVSAAGIGYYWGINHAVNHDKTSNSQSAITDDKGKILYYRNPMGLPDTSPTPKQDSMGMDYIPVYERASDSSNLVQIDSRKVQLLGVQTHAVEERTISRDIRALGNLEIDDTRITDISPRFKGTVDTLFANYVGQQIARGEILFEASVHKLFFAELDYKQAIKHVIATATATTAEKHAANIEVGEALKELEIMGIPHEEIQRLQQGGDPFHQMKFRSPSDGTVMQKNIVEGGHFTAGMQLYRLADLSQLWITAQLPEQELARVRKGDKVRINLTTDPHATLESSVDLIYPAIDENTRSFKLRATVANSKNQLKPGQTAEIWIESDARTALVIPSNALLDSGYKQWVLVALSEGIYEPRFVEIGEHHLDWVEVISGLCKGELVVDHANFLLNSESQLQAALANFAPGKSEDDKSNQHSQSGMQDNAPEPESDHSAHHGMEH